MKIFIIGSKGQLGSEMCKILASGISELGRLPDDLSGAEVFAYDIDTIDITQKENLYNLIASKKPDVIVNCSAYTQVDGCETERSLAYKVNSIGPLYLAEIADELNAKLVQISTDYVFSGEGDKPFTEYDLPSPSSVYGKTKLAGEQFVMQNCKKFFIIRTAWLYSYYGNNFVKTIATLAKAKDSIKVVNDQLGNPTNAADLAFHICKLITTEFYGVYHCTGKGICSWYDFACEIVRLAGIKCEVVPCGTEEYPRPAKRPAFSALESIALDFTVKNEMRDWKEALKVYFEQTSKN